MPMGNKINCVWRDTITSSSKINNVWRNNINGWSRINCVWRSTHQQLSFDPKNVIGFKLIYTLNANRIHHDIPHLKYNPNIPYVFKLTGDTLGNLDYNRKGVVFEYKRDDPEEEGIIIYEGRLYAMMVSGELINVCQMSGNNNGKESEDEMVSEFTNIYESSIVHDVDIKLHGYVLFEDYGYYFAGWNNLFNTKPFIDQTIYPDKIEYKKLLQIDDYIIQPMISRDEYFDSVATIGVARDMHSDNLLWEGVGNVAIVFYVITRSSILRI